MAGENLPLTHGALNGMIGKGEDLLNGARQALIIKTDHGYVGEWINLWSGHFKPTDNVIPEASRTEYVPTASQGPGQRNDALRRGRRLHCVELFLNYLSNATHQ